MGAQFEEFLGRSDKFGSLDLDSAADTSAHRNSSSGRRIILIEEFPTMLTRTSPMLIAFRSSLQRYLAASTPLPNRQTTESIPPVVIVVSETLLGTSTSISDNFTVHRLLGPEISRHEGTSIIDFNPIAPTFMSKALNLVLQKEARDSKRTKIPGPAVLKQLSDMGDIRSAISSLEFLCVRGDESEGWGGRAVAKKKKKHPGDVALTPMEKESLEMVTQREASLGIFHAVGKVVYNKREDASLAPEGSVQYTPAPDHLRHHNRPKISQVSVDNLVNEIGSDIQTFISALHENYVPSCHGSSFTDSLEGCIDFLSDSDVLCSESRRGLQSSWTGIGASRGASGYGSTVDNMLQDEISFQVAVRGMLFTLPYPVNRRLAHGPRSRPGEAHKMFFPASLRLWKQTEERNGVIDMWMRRFLEPSTATSALGRGSSGASKSEGVDSWVNRGLGHAAHAEAGGQEDSPITTAMLISRDEVLLQTLPYMARILGNVGATKELEDITQFHGIDSGSTDAMDDDLDGLDDAPIESLIATQKPSPLRPKRWENKHGLKTTSASEPPPIEDTVEKLVLSDDDIEDD